LRRYFFADDKLYHLAIKMRQNAKKSTKSIKNKNPGKQLPLYRGKKTITLFLIRGACKNTIILQ